MPIETKIKYKKFWKAFDEICAQKGFQYREEKQSGSARRIELFKKGEKTPFDFLVIHEAKVIYSDDLKKACTKLTVTVEEFEQVVESL